jgi:hypothetical protein
VRLTDCRTRFASRTTSWPSTVEEGGELAATVVVELALDRGDVGIAQRHLDERSQEAGRRRHVTEQHVDREHDRLVARLADEQIGPQAGHDVGQRALGVAAAHFEVDLLLVVEVAVERADRDAGVLGDVGSSGRVEAALGEQRLRRFDQHRVRPSRALLLELRRVSVTRHRHRCGSAPAAPLGGGAGASSPSVRAVGHCSP